MLDSSVIGGGTAAKGTVEGDRSSGGKRWPREETLALLKIRCDMEQAFRDSTLKAPLWDEVSRKLGEFGYQRIGKKCKEKFENIYKYHKRTKDGRSNKLNAKNYRFFEQLEHFDSQFSAPLIPPTKPITCSQDFAVPEFISSASISTSSSSSSEGSVKKKRKLVHYFERLVKDVLERQEYLQNNLLEAIERCDQERMAREEAWKMQDTERIKREHEHLAQERAAAAAKDAAVLDFLQKITHRSVSTLFDKPPPETQEKNAFVQENSVGETSTHTDKDMIQVNSSRWPKAEVEALIMLKTDLDTTYQDNGPKWPPLWEEISSQMKRQGYDRSAKRCKEKWENINKYYKRVKESNKRRPEDSKTCPYFDMLESLYAKKLKKLEDSQDNMKSEQMLMQVMDEIGSTGEHGIDDPLNAEDQILASSNLSPVTLLE